MVLGKLQSKGQKKIEKQGYHGYSKGRIGMRLKVNVPIVVINHWPCSFQNFTWKLADTGEEWEKKSQM